MSANTDSANNQIARAAGTVMLAFVLSNLTGLARQILVTDAFGTQGVIDAFNAASTYPDLIFSLIAGGALASAFVPTLAGFFEKKDTDGVWRLASAVTNLVVVILTLISLVSGCRCRRRSFSRSGWSGSPRRIHECRTRRDCHSVS